jgi:hypothetical protein
MKRPKDSRGGGSNTGSTVSTKKSSVARKKPKSAARPYPAERISKAKSQHATSPNPPSAGPRSAVAIHVLSGETYDITVPPRFAATAMYWEHVLRNRIRWVHNDDAARSVLQRSLETLGELGLDGARLSNIAKAGVVEIDIPYTKGNEGIGWELRVFPWEFLLFTATAKDRSGPLIVIRHVCCGSDENIPERNPKTLMVVESAPGPLGEEYSFASERRLVASNLNLQKVPCPKNPTLKDLQEAVTGTPSPDVIHLAGFDSHQAEQFFPSQEETLWDGYLLSDPDGNAIYADAEHLSKALSGDGKRRALLVSCNFWNSAARVAALIAGEAALAAIGFQDEIDDRIAENFFAKFYFNWRALGWNLLRAYRLAVRDVHLGGAVVVLWSARSLIGSLEQTPLQLDANVVGEIKKKTTPDLSKMDPHEVLDLVVKLKETVNYSLLQNNENLFEEFSIRKLCDGPIRNIGVELTLYVGGDSFPYRRIFDTEESYVGLAKMIRFPLTSALLRSIRESVNSVISIKVTWNDKIRYLDTQPVKLLAIDEWVDTPELDAYLPSFVFPRDRAVAKIIDSAQRYLMALNDDAGAGFDGYQGFDPNAKDPSATIDLQARAIWAALSYDLPLSYINPPPSFTASSQRLRTPSDVIEGRRGTCIDLALLLAACLEYAGVDPVIFLLTDHAFPGYWRNEDARQAFIDMSPKPVIVSPSTTKQTELSDASLRSPRKPWIFTNYAEVLQLARTGDIVPIETVWLTQHQGFWDAVDEGMNDLRSKREFASMIDVEYARSFNVTPLPILGTSS